MKRPIRLIIGVAIVVAFFGYLFWSTMAAQAAECRACVVFQGRQNCATASAETKADAERAARTTACGTIAQGMNESIACTNTPPISKECHPK